MVSKVDNKKTGDLGELITANWLENKGYTILNLKYLKKYGEIDVVAQKDLTVHFIEVKTVSYETRQALEYAVIHETWRPEEQVHKKKQFQISKAIEAWLAEYRYTGDFQIDVAAVRIVPRETYATINFLDNVIFE